MYFLVSRHTALWYTINMRFEVPQFIDVEDKLIGPFSFRQFVYLAGGAGICYAIIKLLPIYIAIPIVIPIAGFALALVFYKPNNRPFIVMVQSVINYFLGSRFYLWQQKPQTKTILQPTQKSTTAPETSSLKNNLKDLSWSLDILDKK